MYVIVSALLLSACASLPTDKFSNIRPSSTIGPYRRVTARILVMGPKRVWQAMMDWQSGRSGEGRMRIVQPVIGRIVEFRWRHDEMWLRNNQIGSPQWHPVSKEELASHGMVISLWELSEFLGGHVPPGFQQEGPNRWSIHRNNSRVRVEWNAQKKRLIFSDISHGRKATMIILKSSPSPTPRA